MRVHLVEKMFVQLTKMSGPKFERGESRNSPSETEGMAKEKSAPVAALQTARAERLGQRERGNFRPQSGEICRRLGRPVKSL